VTGSARERWKAMPDDAPRDAWFDALRAAIAEHYLADPGDPYRQSGRGSGALRWEETRRCLVEAIHRDGDFLDVGCANGLLLESLIGWAAQAGFRLVPHGIDFVPELVELARRRHPAHAASFEVANAFGWRPRRRYDFVRTNVEYVPRRDVAAFVRRQLDAVAPGGRLILCHYRDVGEPEVDVAELARGLGHALAGGTRAPGVAAVWIERT
jgi:SAM-dependent methyltransferase